MASTTILTFSSTAYADGIASMSDEERKVFGEEVRAYLLENPEVIVEVIDILEQKQRDAELQADSVLVKTHYDSLTNDGYSFVGGNVEGEITVVEFIDYRCGYCKRAHDEVQALLNDNDDIRYVVKEFPILGQDSVTISRAAISVLVHQGDEAYERFNDAAIRHNGPINENTLRSIAGKAEVDPELMLAHMDDEVVTQVIARNHQLGRAMQISGTPTFLIGSELVRGYVPLDVMQKLVDELRTK